MEEALAEGPRGPVDGKETVSQGLSSKTEQHAVRVASASERPDMPSGIENNRDDSLPFLRLLREQVGRRSGGSNVAVRAPSLCESQSLSSLQDDGVDDDTESGGVAVAPRSDGSNVAVRASALCESQSMSSL